LSQQIRLSISQEITAYIETKTTKNRQAIRQELSRFAIWCGRDRTIRSLTPFEIEEYCVILGRTGDESIQRLAMVKGFLTYLHTYNLTPANLGVHLKLPRAKRKSTSTGHTWRQQSATQLTRDGHIRLQAELTNLKSQRANVIDEIRRAAATKDFSENAPLDAAREQQAQTEARIRQLEDTLAGAIVMGEEPGSKLVNPRACIGSRIVLCHTQTGQELSYVLVETTEAAPSDGRLSASSPVGKAAINHIEGDRIEVKTPRGAVSYTVSKVSN